MIKRAYVSTNQFNRWAEITEKHQIKIIHHHNATNGKNATDIVLVIDAMDLLHDKKDKLDGFCIVSSDSDFTPLVKRMKEEGLVMLGVGSEKSQSFKEVCDEFITQESLQPPKTKVPIVPPAPVVIPKPAPVTVPQTGEHFLELFLDAYKVCLTRKLQDANGRVQLVEIRDVMIELNPAFKNSTLQNLRLLAEKAKALSQQNPQRIKVDEHHDTTPVTHHIQIIQPIPTTSNGASAQPKPAAASSNGASAQPKPAAQSTQQQKDLNKLIRAYTQAIEVSGHQHKDGWLSLSPLGSTLRQLYPNDDHYTYDGVKYGNLGKYVEKINADFPKIVEFVPPSIGNSNGQIRIKNSAK